MMCLVEWHDRELRVRDIARLDFSKPYLTTTTSRPAVPAFVTHLALLVSLGDGGEVHGGHRSRLAEECDDEAPPVVLSGAVHVLDLHVEPRLLRHRVVTALGQRHQRQGRSHKQQHLGGLLSRKMADIITYAHNIFKCIVCISKLQ